MTAVTPVFCPAPDFCAANAAGVFATLTSLGGLFWENLYRDSAFFRNAFRGNDLVTLVVAVPLLLWALWA